MKESKKRRQPGKLIAKSCSQPVNLPGARPLMNPLEAGKKMERSLDREMAFTPDPSILLLQSLFLAYETTD